MIGWRSWLALLPALAAWLVPGWAGALTEQEIMARTHIVNLEARPTWFRSGQAIDFVITVRYDGGTQDGFDVGVYHEGRLVGWARDVRFDGGTNTFRIHDRNFRGDPGAYIVTLRFRGKVFAKKPFATRRHQVTTYVYTVDPQARAPQN